MRKLLVAVMTAMLMAFAAPAFAANTPGGTSEGTDADGAPNNEVDCGNGTEGVDVGATGLTIGGVSGAPEGTEGALVVCNDGGDEALPQLIQGRVILAGGAGTGGGSGYIAADGDADNQPEQAQSYARLTVSQAGPEAECGDVATGDTDAANGDGSQEACNPETP